MKNKFGGTGTTTRPPSCKSDLQKIQIFSPRGVKVTQQLVSQNHILKIACSDDFEIARSDDFEIMCNNDFEITCTTPSEQH